MRLIQPLFSGNIDVIGDIHGEFNALKKLLSILGYDDNGQHPEGRRLVFIGDLVDRGPDSISVVNLIKLFIENGVAQCVAGNHELNILRSQRGTDRKEMRHGNHWYFGEKEHLDRSSPSYIHPQKLANEAQRTAIYDFFLTLPLILEDANYLMVHAAWTAGAHQALQAYDNHQNKQKTIDTDQNLLHAYTYFAERIRTKLEHEEDHLTRELLKQNNNPVKVCTSGTELAAEERYYIKGKWRYTKRALWWNHYEGNKKIIFGHYWRKLPASIGISYEKYTPQKERNTPNPFENVPYNQWLGQSMCIDYSVGGRYYDRQQNIEEGHSGKCLCALRISRTNNERGKHELFFDTGQHLSL